MTADILRRARAQLQTLPLHQRTGRVLRVQGQRIEADGPRAVLGELCRIDVGTAAGLMAQVVALRQGRVQLLPFEPPVGVALGARVAALGTPPGVAVGDALLGRVLDAFGQPLDGAAVPACVRHVPLENAGPLPLQRPPVDTVLETGVRVIDSLLTLGRGQRVGLFAGSGVGKSSLLSRLLRDASCDVCVLALVGERGREVGEAVRRFGPEGLRRSVVIAATAEQPALARVRAAHAAVAIACDFASQGRHVLLAMDSITRLAMARREIALAAGEPAGLRGWPPSVFAELPRLVERCGMQPGGGSVTALLTVLVEGDALQDDPVADALRAVLDGHLVLDRRLAESGQHPAVSVPASVSRLHAQLVEPADAVLAARARDVLSLLERNRALVEMGAYTPGQHAAMDQALALEPRLRAWATQDDGYVGRAAALAALDTVLRTAEAGT